jgi:uncharacterized protein YndB with AHSA1/START domain
MVIDGTEPVRLERHLSAAPAAVWSAMTVPAALAAWFWPATYRTAVSADLRPGGRWRIASLDRGVAVGGEYIAVEPPHRLDFTWRWEQPGDGSADPTVVTMRLSAVEGGTSLALGHDGFVDDEDRKNHRDGWSDCLDRLPGYLSSSPADPSA